MNHRTVIVILVASLVNSQGASIYSPLEDQFEDHININPAIDVPAPEMAALTFANYEIKFPRKISFESTDNDLALVIRFQANEQNYAFPSFTYGRLNDTFIAEHLHYHFGHDEFHEVHYNSKYGNFDEAMKHQDGIAVLFIFMEIPSKQDPFRFSEKMFHPEFFYVTSLGKPIALEDLLPNEADNFNHYFGSLTTPNFNEVVTWTFLDNHIALFLNGST